MGAPSCGQETAGREARVAPERTVLTASRRDSLDIGGQGDFIEEKPEKGKLFFRRHGVLGSRSRGGFGEFDAPDIFFRFQDHSGLIGFGCADVADPDDAETRFAPQAADFDGLAGRSQEANAVETRAVLAEINGVGTLGKCMALRVRAFDDDAESLGDAGFLAGSFPESGDSLFESQTDASFA